LESNGVDREYGVRLIFNFY